jgi:hypothetical protein
MGAPKMNRKVFIKLVVLASFFLILIIGYNLWYKATHLVVVSSSPNNNQKNVSTLSKIEITFNKALSPESGKEISIEPYVNGTVRVVDNKLTFTPLTSYSLNDTYKFCIIDVLSSDAKFRSKNVCVSFRAGFDRNPSGEELEQSVNQTDTLENQYPLLKHIPHSTLDYKIDYDIRDIPITPPEGVDITDFEATSREARQKEVVIIIQLNAIFNRPDQQAEYTAQLKQYKSAALQYIRDNGQNPDTIKIEYVPAEAARL